MTESAVGIWPKARTRLVEAVSEGKRLGVQFYVSLDGEPLWHESFGDYQPGEPLTNEHRLPWSCCSKLLTVLTLASLQDAGEVSTATRIAEILPKFGDGGKQDVTIEHLLTHTVVFAEHDDPRRIGRGSALDAVCRWPIVAPPGERACYNVYATWLVLSEVIQRVTGRDYHEVVREAVLAPLGMDVTAFFWDGRLDRGETTEAELRVLFDRDVNGAFKRIDDYPGDEGWPGSEAWGPANELARPLECVVAGGVWQGRQVFSAEVIEHFCTPVREGIPDEFYQGLDVSWGRGSNTDPAWYGAPGYARVFGHTGYMTSLVMGDRDRKLVVAYLSNTVAADAPAHFRSLEHLAVRDIYETANR